MDKRIVFLVLLFITLLSSCKVAKTTRIYVVRHAERTAGDDLLPAGVTRAIELQRVLSQAKVDSVFSTDSLRTRKTVKPLADAMGLPLIIYNNNTALLDRILKNSKGKTLLVGGHSNTVPDFIQLCGCPLPYSNIPGTQFDNLYLIILQKEKINNNTTTECKLLHMKYGAITN